MTAPAETVAAAFHHEAVLYDDDAGYVDQLMAFIEDGVEAGERVLVALPEERLRLLDDHLDRVGIDHVGTKAMEVVGRNPAWIIPLWVDFVDSAAAAGVGVRGVGEPVWPGRTIDELAECSRHEALLNGAFAGTSGFSLLCPYDARRLEPAVLVEAEHNHPCMGHGGVSVASERYSGHPPDWSGPPLSAVPDGAVQIEFSAETLSLIRHRVAQLASAAGLSTVHIDGMVLAVGEAVSNSIDHGGGRGELAIWCDGDRFLCEVRDHGCISDPMAGRVRPSPDKHGGRGLWIINQLCDLVQIRTSATGQVLRMQLLI